MFVYVFKYILQEISLSRIISSLESSTKPKHCINLWSIIYFYFVAGIWSMFGGGGSATGNETTTQNMQTTSPNELHPLSSHSVLLLLVLCFHYTKENNPYREALFKCKPGRKSEGISELLIKSYLKHLSHKSGKVLFDEIQPDSQ